MRSDELVIGIKFKPDGDEYHYLATAVMGLQVGDEVLIPNSSGRSFIVQTVNSVDLPYEKYRGYLYVLGKRDYQQWLERSKKTDA